ncbi:hypothetical protein [Nitrospina gracilis]|uniref:hypothetical protein n=1 Tax=Nitrospina gracilis TaxID=35801 RepID=UPI001F1D28C6|nr:hypothetical protein [Nitrospina gracilis]MCF8720121.1 hypothetical protein [Nitrospina gracilis Nb-211]
MNATDTATRKKPDLKQYLDPTGVQVLKKRLIAGQITPSVFKQTLTRQMVSQFFLEYTHPVDHALEKMAGILKRERSLIRQAAKNRKEAVDADSETGLSQPFPLPSSKKME